MKKLFLFCCMLITATTTYTQPTDFPKLTGPYLGQTIPGNTFIRFAPGIVPANMFNSVTVSSDGNEIYWGASSGIMVTQVREGIWTIPEFVPFSGKSTRMFFDSAPVVSPDNKKLFFISRRQTSDDKSDKYKIFFCVRTAKGWSEPEPLSDVVNSFFNSEWQISVAASGTIYFGKNIRSNQDFHFSIYYSKYVNGVYTTPQPINVLKDYGDINCPFIAPDESYLIFNKTERSPNGPFVPIGYFICYKGKDNQWLPPQKLKEFPTIGESSFVTRDGKYVFCKENWASAKIIEELRPKE